MNRGFGVERLQQRPPATGTRFFVAASNLSNASAIALFFPERASSIKPATAEFTKDFAMAAMASAALGGAAPSQRCEDISALRDSNLNGVFYLKRFFKTEVIDRSSKATESLAFLSQHLMDSVYPELFMELSISRSREHKWINPAMNGPLCREQVWP